ncbi:translocation/assembly module TamB domain-containing protein [Aliidiomarina soli]|uniref:Translocation and assembly module TamB C-terminal domain-containing protein n=1 Tax=Aliidiomarina soli TaxID=1928574 RepID=A0A432WEZ0_9GAMM|nr:translocation/assembly module TamB domain-containing protein [Aliidiomarina soli]RUO32324.1 hypothetical protein CWE14_09230 [Aliidiomarina soli]
MKPAIKRTLHYTGVGLLVLVSLLISLVVAILLLLGTETGTRATFSLASKLAPGTLEVEHLDGHLLGELNLRQVRYQQGELELDISDVHLEWRPTQLGKRLLHVESFEFSAMQLKLPPSEETEDSSQEPFQPPDINLPVNIQLEHVALRNIRIHSNGSTQQVDTIELRAQSLGSQQHIEYLKIEAPQGMVTLYGEVDTRGRYPFDLNAEATLDLGDTGELTLVAEANGDLDQVKLTTTTEGIADSELTAELSNYLQAEGLRWQANLHLTQLSLAATDDVINDLDVSIAGEGNLEQLDIEVSGWLDSVTQGRVDLDGLFTYADQRLDIDHFKAEVDSNDGEFNLSGFAQLGEQLEVDIQGEVEFLGFTLSEFSLQAEGDQQGASQLSVSAATGQGEIAIDGSFLWQPDLRWDLAVRVDNLELEGLTDQVTGNLNTHITTQGRYTDTLQVFASIESLSGTLDSSEVSGRGEIEIDGDRIQANDFELQLGDALLQADGRYGPDDLTLSWTLQVPNIESLYSQAQGQLQSSGRLSGDPGAPVLHVEVNGADLAYGDYAIGTVELNLDLNTDFENLPTGSLQVSNVAIAEHQIEQVNLTLQQSSNQPHQVALDVEYDQLTMRTQLQGRWSREQFTWQGELQELELRYPELGRWRLTQPAPLHLSERAVELGQSCILIASRESEICLQAEWQRDSNNTTLQVAAENVPYQMFAPWFPEDFNILGEFSLFADLGLQDDQLQSDVRLSISDSSVQIPTQDLRVDLDGGEVLRIQGGQEQLEVYVQLLSEQLEGGVEAEFDIFDVLTPDREFEGYVGIDVQRLTLISAVVPEVQNISGNLNGRLDFSGTINDLNVGGGLELRDGHAEIPATGLDLRNLNMSVEAPSAAQEPFQFTGSVDAGEGQVSIEGSYNLQQQRAQVSVQGDAFPALNTRDLKVTIAPQLEIEYTPELIRLRGSVDVPSARITPPDFETVDSISSDTVFIGRDGTEYDMDATAVPLDMDLTVRLGDDVQVSAYGFEGRLTGQLRIIEQPGQETSAVGNIDVATGEYEIYGQNLNIERGRLIFTGGPVANPGLDLRVERRIEMDSVTAGARVGGTLQNPTFNLFSSPNMQDSAILSYLLFGRGPGQSDTGEANMLARATLALGMSGGNRLGERLTNTLGVDEISLDAGDTFESTSLYIGKQISSRLYIKYGVGLVEPVSTFFIMYRLTDNLNFESHTGNERSGADFFYSIERN